MTVTIKPDHRGEHEIGRKTIARGMPGDPGVTVVTMLVCYLHFAREAAGAAGARHSLRPLRLEGGRFPAKLAHIGGEIAKLCLLNALFENRIRSNSSCASTRCTHRATRTAGSLPPLRGRVGG
jgi:hypothetical protein